MRTVETATRCQVCGNPLPESASTGRPRTTCSDRCRKQKSRSRRIRHQRIASHAARSERAYQQPITSVAEPETREDKWSPKLWETFQEIWEACQTGKVATYESDSGDGTDTTELISLAKAWAIENPVTCLQWDRENTLTAHFWIPQDTDIMATSNSRYHVDHDPPSGMCQIWFDGESPCKMFGEKRYDGLNVCSRHLARISV
jgi:predicted nucleic acid-binding Zn ribbon protein